MTSRSPSRRSSACWSSTGSSLLGAALDDSMLALKMGGIEKVLGGFIGIEMISLHQVAATRPG